MSGRLKVLLALRDSLDKGGLDGLGSLLNILAGMGSADGDTDRGAREEHFLALDVLGPRDQQTVLHRDLLLYGSAETEK